jgi:hypothetical protein
MSWKIKRVIRTDVEFGWPKQEGYDYQADFYLLDSHIHNIYEVEIETTTENGPICHIQNMTTEEFLLRKFLEDLYDQVVVDSIWDLIEDYGQQKYQEGASSADSD